MSTPPPDRYTPLHTLAALLAESCPPLHRQVLGIQIDQAVADLRAQDAVALASATARTAPIDFQAQSPCN